MVRNGPGRLVSQFRMEETREFNVVTAADWARNGDCGIKFVGHSRERCRHNHHAVIVATDQNHRNSLCDCARTFNYEKESSSIGSARCEVVK